MQKRPVTKDLHLKLHRETLHNLEPQKTALAVGASVTCFGETCDNWTCGLNCSYFC